MDFCCIIMGVIILCLYYICQIYRYCEAVYKKHQAQPSHSHFNGSEACTDIYVMTNKVAFIGAGNGGGGGWGGGGGGGGGSRVAKQNNQKGRLGEKGCELLD